LNLPPHRDTTPIVRSGCKAGIIALSRRCGDLGRHNDEQATDKFKKQTDPTWDHRWDRGLQSG